MQFTYAHKLWTWATEGRLDQQGQKDLAVKFAEVHEKLDAAKRDEEAHRKNYLDELARSEKLERSNAALRGTITRLIRKANP